MIIIKTRVIGLWANTYKATNTPDSLTKSALSIQMIEQFTPFRLPINEIFNTIKNKPWVRSPRPIQYDLSLFGVEKYCSYHDGKGTRPSIVRAS